MHTNGDLRLELNDLAAGYGARRVLAGLTLTLRGGETLVVAGANGSGKSTLLRLICGLQRPTAGTITYISGERRAQPEEARDLVGWVAPDLQLYRELTLDSASRGLRAQCAVGPLKAAAAAVLESWSAKLPDPVTPKL